MSYRCTPRTRIVGIDEATGYYIWSFYNPRLGRYQVFLVRYSPPPSPVVYKFVCEIKKLWIGCIFHFEYTEREDRTRNLIVEAHIETAIELDQINEIMSYGNCALTAWKEDCWSVLADELGDEIIHLFGYDCEALGTYGFYISSEPRLKEDVRYPEAYKVIRHTRPYMLPKWITDARGYVILPSIPPLGR